MERINSNKKNASKTGGVFLTGSMFLGMGIGMLFGAMKEGMFIGMGVGFLMMAVIYFHYRS